MRTVLAVTAVMAALAGLLVPPARAQDAQRPSVKAQFTVDPVMAKGPADAPVTIVEFSDYQ